MRVCTGPQGVFLLVILACSGTFPPAQGRVVVSSADNHDLKWTAHRLGVCAERVAQGRRALQLATDLVPRVAGNVSVESLGDLWLTLSWNESREHLKALLTDLRHVAERTSDLGAYAMVSADARGLYNSLLRVDEGTGRSPVDGWPSPPEAIVLDPFIDIGKIRSFHRMVRTDLDLALAVLRNVEAGRPHAALWWPCLARLSSEGRAREAAVLFRDLVEAMPYVRGEYEASFYGVLLTWVIRHRPEMAKDFTSSWAGLIRRFPPPEGNDSGPLDLGEGVVLSARERSLALALALLQKHKGREHGQHALSHFPALSGRLEGVGGLDGFLAIHMQEIEKLRRERQEGAERDEISRLLREAEAAKPGDLRFDPNGQARHLNEAVNRLKSLEETALRERYLQVARAHLRIQGGISEELLALGREVLSASEPPLSAKPKATRRDPDVLPAWLHAASCWMDFESSIKEVQSLDEELQFAVGTKLATWIAHKGFN